MASHAAAAFASLALLAACAGEDPRAVLPQVRPFSVPLLSTKLLLRLAALSCCSRSAAGR